MELLAEGYNTFNTHKKPGGIVKFLPTPQAVIDLLQGGRLKDYILLVRGGTTTFLAPALSMGAIGVITMSGAPESHLGILTREFQIPCVMTAYLTASSSRYVAGATADSHFDEIVAALNGRKISLDCTDHDTGRIFGLV